MEIPVRFKKDVQIERAYPKDSGKGGFWIERIPKGSTKKLQPRSVQFWKTRDPDCIEVLEEQAPAPAAPINPVREIMVAAAPSLAMPATAACPEALAWTKCNSDQHITPAPAAAPSPGWTTDRRTELRHAIDAVLAGSGDLAAVLVFDLASLPGINLDSIDTLKNVKTEDPFRFTQALRNIRKLVPGRPGRKPRSV